MPIAKLSETERDTAIGVLTRLPNNANTATYLHEQRGLWMAVDSGAYVNISSQTLDEHHPRNQRHIAQPLYLETAGGNGTDVSGWQCFRG